VADRRQPEAFGISGCRDADFWRESPRPTILAFRRRSSPGP